MSRALKVGIIGASAESGWAPESHVPAVRVLRGLELGAVVTTSQAGSDKAPSVRHARRVLERRCVVRGSGNCKAGWIPIK